MRAEMDEHMGIVKMAETKEKLKQMKKNEKNKKTKKERQVHHLRVKQVKEKSILPLSLRLKKTQRIQQGNNPPEQPKKRLLLTFRSEKSSIVEKQKTKKKTKRTPQKYEIGTEELEEILRESRKKKNNEKSATQGEKEADLRSTEGHYVSSETIPEVNLGTVDPLSQGHTDQSSVNKPAESMLGLVEESANEPAKENMMVVRIETQSQTEALQIVPIQVCLPLSQTTTVPEIEPTPVPEIKPTPAKSPSEKTNEETTKMCILSLLGCISSQLFCNTAALQNHRQTLNKAHPRFHQLHLNPRRCCCTDNDGTDSIVHS
ncbi:hypothetical protein Ahy_A02g010025 isoform H [Arachis hypogaea]|uniref:Uncharacterized protein n=1 Tax=Arachis hypogaea TaxID=3818 RepID=A0A445EIT1_ARAHY|nr:hypothetical protein Ahy_A02g010025 isoform H [Arachis hypogaea]